MTKRVYNFSPGPSMLPLVVLEAAQRDLVALPDAGMSILEISHRSKWFDQILQETEANLRQLLQIPNNYHVLFLQGGATTQFSMLAMNLLRGKNQPADYIVTGTWGTKAVKEAQREGEVRVIWNGKADNYNRVPQNSELNVDSQAAYIHFTSNETIQGVEFPTEPETGNIPLVCDMSSDFLSRPININRYGLIYAGAQKNAGPAGATVVIIRDDLMQAAPNDLHTMLDYRIHAAEKSCYNTPPVFSIYLIGLVTRWLLNDIGGLEAMATLNREKANLLYDAIDQSNGFYKGHARPESRSMMNVTFTLPNADLEKQLIKEAEARGLYELKGHRSVGGLRASIYNAMPRDGLVALRDFMLEFQARQA